MINKEQNDLKVKKFRKDTKNLLKLLSKNRLVSIKIDFNNFTTYLSCNEEIYKITLNDSFNWVYLIDNVNISKQTLSESILNILDSKVIKNLKNELEQIISESVQVQYEINNLNELKSNIIKINKQVNT